MNAARSWLGVVTAFGLGCTALACGDDSTTNDGGSDAGLDGTSNEAGDASQDATKDSPGDGSVGSGQCSTTATWSAGTSLAISTAQSDFLGSITPDELSIAWMTTAGTVLYADRQVATDPFGAPQTLSAGIALDRVSLSSDGLTLVVVETNRYTLAQTTRSARGAAFSATLDTTLYASLDPPVTEVDGGNGPAHGLFADPVLSADGQFLYYSQYGDSVLTIAESYRLQGDTSPWAQGRNLLESDLTAPDLSGTRMRPTGLSSDDLTLFFYDMTANKERAGFRADPLNDNTYKTFVDIGASYENATPTASCSRIYFSGAGSGGLDLFFADKN